MRRTIVPDLRGSGLWLVALLALLGNAGIAWAQAGPLQIDVMVSKISNKPGSIDPRAARLHERLSGEFRYESLSVVQTQQMNLAIDQVGSMRLPNGKRLQVKPLLVDERGALIAVDLQGGVSTDLRVHSDHLVVIGADRHGDGKLVISLEPHF